MIDIKDIKTEDLQEPSRYAEIQAALVEAIEEGRAMDTFEFRKKVQEFFRIYSDLEDDYPDLFKNYRKLVLYINLENFELLQDDLQTALLEKHFTSFEKVRLDVVDKVSLAVTLETDILQNDKRDTLMAALLKNNETIGTERIEVGGRMVQPTIGNWVTKYRTKFGNKKQDSLVVMDFTTRDEARSLAEEDRAKLTKLLEVVELLKPEEDEMEEYAPEEVKQETRPLSPLYVPAKKPKAPIQEVKQVAKIPEVRVPKVSDMNLRTTREPVVSAPVVPSVPSQATHQFRSLADLEYLDINMARGLGVSMDYFIDTLKNEVYKVYTRSPQSKPHIVELWRKSPLYQLYVQMGEESMKTRQPIQEVARKRANQNQPSLTQEEYDLVAALSKTIQ